MAEDSSPESLSRRAFLRRIGRGARSDTSKGKDGGRSGSADDGRRADEEASDGGRELTPEQARRQLESLGVSVMPLSEDQDALQVQCKRVGNQFGVDEARLLEPLAPHVAWLDLARTGIGDSTLEIVGKMADLRRLYLQNTAVQGPGLAHLTELEHLEYLNLFGTEIDDSALAHVAEIESLQTVYLMQTEVSDDGVQGLRDDRPDLSVEFGDPFGDG